MVKNNVRKIIVCLICVVMVLAVAKTCLATGNDNDILNQLKTGNGTPGNSPKAEEIPEGETPNKLDPNNTLNKNDNLKPNNTPNNAPTTTPYTGIGDYSSIIFIGIFAVSALYAYKKIREYNA